MLKEFDLNDNDGLFRVSYNATNCNLELLFASNSNDPEILKKLLYTIQGLVKGLAGYDALLEGNAIRVPVVIEAPALRAFFKQLHSKGVIGEDRNTGKDTADIILDKLSDIIESVVRETEKQADETTSRNTHVIKQYPIKKVELLHELPPGEQRLILTLDTKDADEVYTKVKSILKEKEEATEPSFRIFTKHHRVDFFDGSEKLRPRGQPIDTEIHIKLLPVLAKTILYELKEKALIPEQDMKTMLDSFQFMPEEIGKNVYDHNLNNNHRTYDIWDQSCAIRQIHLSPGIPRITIKLRPELCVGPNANLQKRMADSIKAMVEDKKARDKKAQERDKKSLDSRAYDISFIPDLAGDPFSIGVKYNFNGAIQADDILFAVTAHQHGPLKGQEGYLSRDLYQDIFNRMNLNPSKGPSGGYFPSTPDPKKGQLQVRSATAAGDGPTHWVETTKPDKNKIPQGRFQG